MIDPVDNSIGIIEACETLEMLNHLIESLPGDPSRRQLHVMVAMLLGGITEALSLLQTEVEITDPDDPEDMSRCHNQD
ncbi:hypothetical protein DESC_240072 [Desulfosarcina cetonica]|uniref:hypothetical protein n=1 Tax=Desulfosarcina cetonica TaxID=90730 RepID=UPI0012ED279A|nr:hypothetical protein [Desulfosarcina cetonica]VTR64681.1 hypothetical protein DESC_240072 [Desulfosarcina cetonica]